MAWNPERMKTARTKQKLTLKELGVKLDLAWRTLQRYETGGAQPKINRVVEIAAALDTSTSYLVEEVDDPSAVVFLRDLSPDERELIRARRNGDLKTVNRIMHEEAVKQMRRK